MNSSYKNLIKRKMYNFPYGVKIKEKVSEAKRKDTGQKGLRMYEINICRCSP